ncbi:histidine phosphatase family protein, partial [Streptococcus ruminantium]
MAKTIYLMRHGETLFNTQKRVQGWSDSPLTEKGI